MVTLITLFFLSSLKSSAFLVLLPLILKPLGFFVMRDFVSLDSVLTQKNKFLLICQCSLICSHTVFSKTFLQLRLL